MIGCCLLRLAAPFTKKYCRAQIRARRSKIGQLQACKSEFLHQTIMYVQAVNELTSRGLGRLSRAWDGLQVTHA